MNKETLKKLGIEDDELIQKIIIEHGKDIEAHKGKVMTMQTELETYQKQLADASAQIEGFKGMDIAGIKSAADEWKAKAEKAQAEANAQISKIKFDYALDQALASAKAKNQKAVKALLDTQALKLTDDGKIDGLDVQLSKVQAENDYLFEGETTTPKIIAGGTNQKSLAGDSVALAARKAAGLPTE